MKILGLLLFALISIDVSAQTLAVRDYDVLDSIGVNTHWTFGSPYDYLKDFARLIALMRQAHLVHFRDSQWGSGSDTQPWVASMYNQLAAAGLRADLILAHNTSLAAMKSDLKLYSGVEAIELMNEWDYNGGSAWVTSMHAMLPVAQQLGIALGLPVIGPSLVQASSYPKLGNVSQYLTAANVHDYQGNRNPETSGWGGGVNAAGHGFGSLLWYKDKAHEYAPGLPVWATETGFQTGPYTWDIPESVEATYAPRLYLASFKRGLPRTYLYELVDEPSSWFSTYGLLRHDLTPKPAYTAIESLLSILADTPAQFAPESLNYSLNGNTHGVETLLMEKSNGAFWLAVWLDGAIWDVNTHVATPLAPHRLELKIPNGMVATWVGSFHSNGTVTATKPNTASFSVNANSNVTMIRIGYPGR